MAKVSQLKTLVGSEVCSQMQDVCVTRVGVSDDLDKNDDLMTQNRVIMT